MDDHRTLIPILACHLEVEPLGELEVKLDRRTLERSTKRIPDRNINLGTIKRAIARIYLPFAGVVFIEGFGELLSKEGEYESYHMESVLLTSSAASHVSILPR